jgi:hypothetical protein
LLSVAVVGGISLPIVLVFGLRELFFSVIFIPSQHPWYPNTLSRIYEVLLLGGLEVRTFKHFLVLGLVSEVALLCTRSRRNKAKDRSPLVWLPFVLAGLIEMPFAVLGILKVGGGVNSLSHVFFYWTVAGLLALGGLLVKWPRAGWLLLAIALLLGSIDQRRIARLLADHSSWGDDVTSSGRTWIEEQRMVVDYLRAHPGDAYFPLRPLEHLAVEGQLLHFEDGIICRELASKPLSPHHLRQHIPPGVRLVCYPASRSYGYYITVQLLSEFDRRLVIDELPGCLCYGRTCPDSSRKRDSPGPTSTPPPMPP